MQLAAFVPSRAPRMQLSRSGIDALVDHTSTSVTIAAADCNTSREYANALLNERYGWRGYDKVHLPQSGSATHLPLTASQDGVVIGTLTVAIDSEAGLNCDRAFGDEVNALRENGAKLCEFTKLAVDPTYGSDQVLAAMFHVAYLAANRLEVDTLLMEVNPRHMRYYVRMLGASVIGGVRSNTIVNAPAVLLSMAFSDVRRRIDERAGGGPRTSGAERSLYSLFFSVDEEKAIVSRLPTRIPFGAGRSSFGFRLPQAHADAPIEEATVRH